MRITKIIELTFNNTQNTTALIQVPFLVKQFRVIAAAYNNGDETQAEEGKYGFLKSNLGDLNSPLAVYFQEKIYPVSTTYQNIFEFSTPKQINGYYNFELSIPTLNGGDDKMIIMLEFLNEDI